MKNKVGWCAGVMLLLMVVSPSALATITGVEIIEAQGYGMSSNFTTTTHQQILTGTNGAKVYGDAGQIWQFTGNDISATFTNAVDQSSGGLAQANFIGGTWYMKIKNGGVDVLRLSGSVDWYWEKEAVFPANSNKINGQGRLTVTEVFIDQNYFGPAAWAYTTAGKSAIITSISNALPSPLTSYTSNWHSSNATMTVWADMAKVTPEPASMALLGLGVLGLLRKRK